MTKKIYTLAETASLLRVSRQTIYVYRRAGKIGSFKIGNKCLFTEEHVQKFIKTNEAKG